MKLNAIRVLWQKQMQVNRLPIYKHTDLCWGLDAPRMYVVTNLHHRLIHLVSLYSHPQIHCHLKAGKIHSYNEQGSTKMHIVKPKVGIEWYKNRCKFSKIEKLWKGHEYHNPKAKPQNNNSNHKHYWFSCNFGHVKLLHYLHRHQISIAFKHSTR